MNLWAANITRATLFLLLMSACYACSWGTNYVKIERTDPDNWLPQNPKTFTFQPLNIPNDIKIVWRVDHNNLTENFALTIRTTTLHNNLYFLDTLRLTPQNTQLDCKRGYRLDLFTTYCQNASLANNDSTVKIEIAPLNPIQGIHYIGLEVTNATYTQKSTK